MVAPAEFPRIVADHAVLGGKPCIRGTRLSVEFILELVASGGTRDTIAARHPSLKPTDVDEAVRYAAKFLQNEVFISSKADE